MKSFLLLALCAAAATMAVAAAAAGAAGDAAEAALPTMPLTLGLQTSAGAIGGLLGKGYDPIYQKPRGPVYEYTYNNMNQNNNQYFDREFGRTFKLPDQVTVLQDDASTTTSSINAFSSFSSYKSWEEKESSTSFGFFFFSFSSSDASSYLRETMKDNRSYVATASHTSNNYKLDMWSTEVMKYEMAPGQNQANSTFTQALSALPASRNSDQEVAAYQTFIDQYGTHFMSQSVMGGAAQFMIVTNASAVASMGSHSASSQWSFGIDLIFVGFGFETAHNHSSGSLTKEFKENSQAVLISYGGNPGLVSEGNYSLWADSIYQQPVPVNSTYLPVYDLVQDANVAANLKDAVTEYLNTKPAHTPVCAQAPGKTISGANLPNLAHHGKVTTHLLDWDSLEAAAAEQMRIRADKAAAAEAAAAAAARKEQMVKAVANAEVQPIPAVDSSIGRGFDAKSGRVMLPVTTFEYNLGKTWFNPIANAFYALPDSLEFASIPSACFLETMVTLSNSSDVWNYLAKGFGFDLSIQWVDPPIGVGVGFSHQQAGYRALTHNFTHSLTQMHRFYVSYSLSFGSGPLRLSPILDSEIAALPDTPGPAYAQLIKYWGTHYVSRSDFGGACNFTVLVDKTYTKKAGWNYVSNQIELSVGLQMKGIGIDVDLGFGLASLHGKVDAEFRAASKVSYNCVGGNLGALAKKDYNKWASTIQNGPVFIPSTQQLRPLSMLITDPVKSAIMAKAIVDYINAP